MGSSPSSGSNSQQDDDDGVLETFETVEHEEYLIVGKNTSSQDILHPAIDQVAAVEPRGFSMFMTCTSSPWTGPAEADLMMSSNMQHSSVKDIPFLVNPCLGERERICSMLNHLDLEIRQFDWAKYLYDFEFEQKVLRDLNIGYH
ncbi:hypothetical protein C0Q70_09620 [Pomacea canaliculata]|uniref:Uncharacterized protein n=2 Tax=Pomacea canaliculata TaxID=400727 RepID=A0A2T7PAC2_POMCA|nr:hypothetical protein C0Q70_09620 [Pomacea canaliculata]